MSSNQPKITSTQFGRNDELLKVMGWKIREARFYNGKMSQRELAKRAGTKQPSIVRAEKGDISSVRNWLHLIHSAGSEVQFHISLETNQYD